MGFVQNSVEDFIHRIEDRSSLLMMTGLDIEDGRLVEFYEFRHLTFQEFLTARAMVEGWHPGRKDGDTLVTVLEPHFEEEEWQEVIPLAAALGGKATEAIVQRLTESVGVRDDRKVSPGNPLTLALGNCLADEVAARPEVIRAAIQEMVRLGGVFNFAPFTVTLARGRYGTILREEARNAWLNRTGDFWPIGLALQTAVLWQTIESESPEGYEQASNKLLSLLSSQELGVRCEGAVGCRLLCQQLERNNETLEAHTEVLQRIGSAVMSLLFSDTLAEIYAADWALFQLGRSGVWYPPAEPDMLGRLFTLWRATDRGGWFASTIMVQRLISRDDGRPCSTIQPEEFASFVQNYSEMREISEQPAALIIAYYLRTPWNDTELVERARKSLTRDKENRTLRELLERLGEKP